VPTSVGTALTVQLAFGFLLTAATMWPVPLVHDHAGWWAAFAMLAPGPLLGAWALRCLDDRSTAGPPIRAVRRNRPSISRSS